MCAYPMFPKYPGAGKGGRFWLDKVIGTPGFLQLSGTVSWMQMSNINLGDVSLNVSHNKDHNCEAFASSHNNLPDP